MDKYEVGCWNPGQRYFKVPVPGTDVTANLSLWESEPNVWYYGLVTAAGEELAVSSFDFTGVDGFETLNVTPLQVANLAFLVEIEWNPSLPTPAGL